MKCQILLTRKNKKNISKCLLLKFLSSMQSVKVNGYTFREGKSDKIDFALFCKKSLLLRGTVDSLYLKFQGTL